MPTTTPKSKQKAPQAPQKEVQVIPLHVSEDTIVENVNNRDKPYYAPIADPKIPFTFGIIALNENIIANSKMRIAGGVLLALDKVPDKLPVEIYARAYSKLVKGTVIANLYVIKGE